MSGNISHHPGARAFEIHVDGWIYSTASPSIVKNKGEVFNISSPSSVCGKDDESDTTSMLGVIIGLLMLNILLHASGCRLLWQTLNHTKGYVQQLFILNLSLSELIKNIVKLIRYLFKLILEVGSFKDSGIPAAWCVIASTVKPYCKWVHIWGIYALYFTIMVYLTVDRLLATTLTLTYKVYVTDRRAKCLLVFTWLAIGGLALGMILAYGISGFVVSGLLPAYIYGVLHIGYAILAMFTYAIMFYKFAQSQRLHGSRRISAGSFRMTFKKQYSQAFKESRFFVCIWIITSFCVLSVIPGLYYIHMTLQGLHKQFPNLKLLVHFCYILSDTMDASIYIFLQRSIRRLLMQKLFCFRGAVKKDSFFSRDRNLTVSTSTRSGETAEMLKC